jgi:pimeloyl-ACP methyl ester carboxylesterase
MSQQKQTSPFDPNEFAEWMLEGLKETVKYRVSQTLRRDRWVEAVKARIPNKNQVLHFALRQAFEKAGFRFEELKQGDAVFYVIRKTLRETPAGQKVRRLVFVPGLGDSPGSWLPFFTLSKAELTRRFDEVLVIDFPGYMGFLSHHEMVSSMEILLGVVRMVCDLYPPEVLMGHSLGAWLAGKTAQQFNLLIEQFIAIAPSGLIPTEERRIFGDFIVRNQGLTLEELLELIVFDPKKFGPLLNRDFKEFYERPSIRSFVDSVRDDHFIDGSRPFMAKKLTVIWGDTDRFVPTHWVRNWIESYGEYLDAYVLKKTGHIPQMERPLVTSKVLAHALSGDSMNEGFGWTRIQTRRNQFDGIRPVETTDNSPRLLK